MGLLCFVYLICALRTNIVFLVIFATLVVAFGLLTGTYWQLAMGNAALGAKLQIVSTELWAVRRSLLTGSCC